MTAALITVALVSSVALASPSSSSGGSAKGAYNAIPSKVTGNVPSLGFQAYSTDELGDIVGLGGTARTLQSMSVLFSSWACQTGAWETANCVTTPGATFPVPVTFKIYDYTGGTQGAELATQTQTVNVQYRPSTSANCTGGRWYNSKDKTCYNGLPQTITMAMTATALLPEQVIWTVAYNTNTHGYVPTGVVGPVDSLNVGLNSFPNAPYTGTDLNEDQIFIVTTYPGFTDLGWTGQRPLGSITTR